MLNVFILDDNRTFYQAFRDAGLNPPSDTDRMFLYLARPDNTKIKSISPVLDTAMSTIAINPRFSLWILDYDLGLEDVTGLDFLEACTKKFPDKVPLQVISCSGNPHKKADIEAFHNNWIKHKI